MLEFKDCDKILFAGDSVTDDGRGRPIGEGLWDGVGRGFVRQFDTMLNVCYPELLLHIINMGNGGATSRDLLAGWEDDVMRFEADYVIMSIGINDVWRQFDSPAVVTQHVYPDEYEDNVRRIVGRTVPLVRRMVLMTPYYMEPCRQDMMRAKMDEYGEIMKRIAAQYNVTCIDLQAVFDDYLQYRHSSYLQWDRVHPGPVGSLLIARRLLREFGFEYRD